MGKATELFEKETFFGPPQWPCSWSLLLLLERAGDLNLLSGLKALSFTLLAEGLDFLQEFKMNPGILCSAARL